MRKRLAIVAVALTSLAMLGTASSAGAAWHYEFKHFIKTSTTTSAAGLTEVKRCARGLAGDWRFSSQIEVETFSSSSEPKTLTVEFEIKAKMPITSKFRPVRDVDVAWTATLPTDPDLAAFYTAHYERLAQSQSDFYEGMSVRWRPAKKKLDIRHDGLTYDGYPQLAPGTFTTAFKPKPGC